MGEPPSDVTGGHGVEGRDQRGGQGARGPGFGRAQLFLDFGDALLHRVEVRRVGGQITDPGAGGGDGRHRLGSGVKVDVIPPDLLTGAQTGDQELLDVAREERGVDRPFNQKRGTEPVYPHGANDREVRAALKGLGDHRPLAAGGTRVSACHREINAKFIQKD